MGKRNLCLECEQEFILAPMNIEKLVNDPLDGFFSVYYYRGRMAQAIQKFKYYSAWGLGKPFSEIMNSYAVQLGLFHVDAILPIPTHWKKRLLRGANPPELLCEYFPPHLVRTNWLVKTKPSSSQASLKIKEREKRNIKQLYKCQKSLSNKKILLIDDVVTTFNTARTCAHILKESGAKEVYLFTLARSY